MKGNYNLSSGFLLLYDWMPIFNKLDDTKLGTLVRALMNRQRCGIAFPHFEDDFLQIAAEIIEPTILRRLEGQKAGLKSKKQAEENAPPGVPPPPSEAKQSEAKLSKAVSPPPPSAEEKDDERFALFWETYPKKQAKNAAREAFRNADVTDALLQRMLDAIAAQKKSRQWLESGGKYIPFPETWILRKQWEDEPDAPPHEDTSAVNEANFNSDEFFTAAVIRSYGYDPREK